MQELLALVQASLAAILVWVTWQYARTTARIAEETRAAAAASQNMVAEMRQRKRSGPPIRSRGGGLAPGAATRYNRRMIERTWPLAPER
jgi:hypothetical protein